jgi:hypothetical protein
MGWRATFFVLLPMAAACGSAPSSTTGGADAGDAGSFDATAGDGVASDGATNLGPSPTVAAFCSALVSAASRGYLAAHPEGMRPRRRSGRLPGKPTGVLRRDGA